LPYTTDPARIAKLRVIVTWVIASPLITGAAWWALRPLDEAPTGLRPIEPQIAPTESGDSLALELSGFNAPIWRDPPAQTESETVREQRQAPFPALELVAIIADGDAHRAAIYIPGVDEFRIVGAGESLTSEVRVVAIESGAVELEHRGRIRHLLLDAADNRKPVQLGRTT